MSKNAKTGLELRMTVYCALFTALIIIGGYISLPIPVGPVPIVLADFFVMISGMFLGFRSGLASVGLYLALGAIGLPVFAGGTSGLAVIFGPTGGFLFGYLLAAGAVGFIMGKMKPTVAAALISLTIGNILLYALGVPWLKFVLNMSWPAAVAAGLTPFIAGIAIKIAVAAAMCPVLLPRFRQTLASFSNRQSSGEES